ncbi:MAG TPA: patatin-like phospholipase family protein, partial [Candidatus Competibacteraceae bacterium]|nr:patatin-like phospholipase family protein [Candidatus Competibacteraceae bacterium]
MFDLTAFHAATRQHKTGLALSGGGLRASLFHIGVLARLAELDLLRHVDVISTVSGGSIIGAYYYLKAKELLEGRCQDRLIPDRAAYIRLVQEVEIEFLQAVQKNMRMRAFLDRRKNARMFREGYSSTDRMAELYTKYLYEPVQGASGIFLRDLPIEPAAFCSSMEEPPYKIPTLILNATALNTGNLWQFTGTSVGEEVSCYKRYSIQMPVLPKLYFDSPALTPLQRFSLHWLTLGQAVAASCCVPGLYEPLCLSGLYKTEAGEDMVIRLVDGGVFDNQGLVSLFAAGCTHIICSDASDLLKSVRDPSTRLINVAIRANEIMMDRIRNKILDDLFARPPETYAFFHLGAAVSQQTFPEDAPQLLYALSHIRTDLDSFTDQEAYTLMYYGYRLVGEKFQCSEMTGSDWCFLRIQDLLRNECQRQILLQHLSVGSKQLFKVFFLKKPMPYAIVLAALLVPVSIIVFVLSRFPWWVSGLLVLFLLSIVAYSQNARINQYIDKVERLRRARRRLAKALTPLGIPALLGAIGAVVTWVHLTIFDRLFL